MGYGVWLHGEAVATGMLLAARLSARLGWIGDTDVARVQDLLSRAQLPVVPPRIGAERAMELMSLDKKVMAGRIRLVLLQSLGSAVVSADYDGAALVALLQEQMGA
jgi:3-dehydroquinate synthase